MKLMSKEKALRMILDVLSKECDEVYRPVGLESLNASLSVSKGWTIEFGTLSLAGDQCFTVKIIDYWNCNDLGTPYVAQLVCPREYTKDGKTWDPEGDLRVVLESAVSILKEA